MNVVLLVQKKQPVLSSYQNVFSVKLTWTFQIYQRFENLSANQKTEDLKTDILCTKN